MKVVPAPCKRQAVSSILPAGTIYRVKRTSILELFAATAILLVAATAVSKSVRESAEWKKSGDLAQKAIARARAKHKEPQ